MKRIITILAALLLGSTVLSNAQGFQTGYFLDNYSYGYRINPALQSDRSFLGLAINNVTETAQANFGASNFLFNAGGKLVTGLNSAVSSAEFLSGLPQKSAISFDVAESLLAAGVWKKGVLHTLELNTRFLGNVSVPKDMFAFLKNGASTSPYDLGGLGGAIQSYIEIAYGYSRQINDMITVGGRLKFLIGAASANMTTEKFTILPDANKWQVSSKANVNIAGQFMSIPSNSAGSMDWQHIQMLKMLTPAGFGAALDMGVTVKPIDGLTVSAALVDIGGISWKYNISGQASGEKSYTGVDNVDLNNGGNAISDAFKDIMSIADFKPVAGKSAFEGLPLTVNLGARYQIPGVNFLSVGMLGSYGSFHGVSSFNARAGVTLTPISWFSFAASAGMGNFGANGGAALSVNAGPFAFHLGFETYFGKLAKQYIPLNKFRETLSLGLTLRFGQRH